MKLWEKVLFLFSRNKKSKENKEEKKVFLSDSIDVSLEQKEQKDRDIIQSYILTTAKSGFFEYEKKILIKTIEAFQSQLTGQESKGFLVNKNQYGSVDVTLSLSFLLSEGGKDTISQLEIALTNLQKNTIRYDDDGKWISINLIERPEIAKDQSNIQFRLHYKVYNALLSFSLGHQKQELEAIIAFRNIYAQRFYRILKEMKGPVAYSIDELKALLQVEGEYKSIYMFIDRVLDKAKDELNKKGPIGFNYQFEYEKERGQRGRKKITAIVITPIFRSIGQQDKIKEQSQTKIQKKRKSQVSKTRKSGRKKSAKTPDSSKDKNQSE